MTQPMTIASALLAIPALLTLLYAGAIGADTAGPTVQKLGAPVLIGELPLSPITRDPDGYYIAGHNYEQYPDRLALLGVRLDTGACRWVSLPSRADTDIAMPLGRDSSIYLYAMDPSHFMRYDVKLRKLVDLGVPADPANYYGAGCMGPDGRFWGGFYPATYLVSVDTNTRYRPQVGRARPTAGPIGPCSQLSTQE
jgi:hypothetical protein